MLHLRQEINIFVVSFFLVHYNVICVVVYENLEEALASTNILLAHLSRRLTWRAYRMAMLRSPSVIVVRRRRRSQFERSSLYFISSETAWSINTKPTGGSGVRLNDGPDIKLFILVGSGRSFLSIA